MKEFEESIEIMSRLRRECPWDQKQTLESLRSFLIEEAYECLTAMNEVRSKGPDSLIEELGDLALQILFQAEILQEELQRPILPEIFRGLNEKLIRRHPHIFSKTNTSLSAEEVLQQWNELKEKEKAEKGIREKTFLEGVPKDMPSLSRAFHFGKKSEKVRFDWTEASQVWTQVESEIEELKHAKNREEEEHEFGDILFALCQWARHRKIDPEVALARANDRFQKRVETMEQLASKSGKFFKALSLEEKEELWKQAKALNPSS